MRIGILLPAFAAVTLLGAAPASAQYARYWDYAPQQGGGGAGPYAPECQSFHNFNQKQECTEMVMAGRYYRGYSGYYGPPRYRSYYGDEW
jgi:hypothetical protein